MNEKALSFLRRLVETPSPSGFEERASKVWRDYLTNSVESNQTVPKSGIFVPRFSISTDTYGNSIATLNPWRSGGNTIMLCAHIDEVGMMINYINDEGFLYISQIGGVEATILPAQRVIVHNKNGPINGVIGRRPYHLADEDDDEEVKFHNVFVDIGAKDRDDALTLVSVGDPITFDASYRELANNRVVARGLDDRMGAWVVAEVIRRLAEKNSHRVPVVGVTTIQEENGAYGATMVVNKVKPDVAIAIDVTHATDVPDVSKEKHGDCKLGEGPVLSVGSVSHKKVNELLEQVATQERIPIQKQISPCWTGTDGDAVFLENGGIPTGLVSVPNRYMHSPVEIIQLDDLENAVKLIVAWCESVGENTSWKL